jgi:hypothetical protein
VPISNPKISPTAVNLNNNSFNSLVFKKCPFLVNF